MCLNKIVISGIGCVLADFLYNNISFDSETFKKYLSKKPGDGGLSPGKLVFTEELENYSGESYFKIIKEITGNREPDSFNVGGPALVSLIHASQMLDVNEYKVKFYGAAGNDKTACKIFEIVRETPLDIENYTIISHSTPFTDVFSDPAYDNGNGERTFVNNLGAAREYSPGQIHDSFFNSHIICFGGTALVPQIHDNLASLLCKAKKNNCITVVNTVFDFRNEKRNPGSPWPLVGKNRDLELIDILIMDCEEALKISGMQTVEKAANYFTSTRLSSFIITNGANNIFAWSGGGLLKKTNLIQLPVSKKVAEDLKTFPSLRGDTTGCGDNFAGGVIASIAMQLKNKKTGQFDLIEAASWGIASGGFTCFVLGGTFIEKVQGEKRAKVQKLRKDYLQQIEN